MIKINLEMPESCDMCPFCMCDWSCGNYSCDAYGEDISDYIKCRHDNCNLEDFDK